MLTEKLRSKIESGANSLASQNMFFRMAREGKISKEQIANYTYNLEYAFRTTILCLNMAKEIASVNGASDLHEFFVEKIEEELGHDQWARNDFAHLGFGETTVKEENIDRDLLDLMNYTKTIIQEDPHLYLIYMLFAEYVTVRVAPDMLNALAKHCGIGRESFTAISNHETLDKDHADEDFAVIGRLLSDEAKHDRFLKVIDYSFEKLNGFLNSMAERRSPVWN